MNIEQGILNDEVGCRITFHYPKFPVSHSSLKKRLFAKRAAFYLLHNYCSLINITQIQRVWIGTFKTRVHTFNLYFSSFVQ